MRGSPLLIALSLLIALTAAPVLAQEETAGDGPRAEFAANWFYDDRPPALVRLEGQPAPQLYLNSFYNGNPVANGGLAGKIVVVDLWATWCGPCLAAIPDQNEVARLYAGDGVVVLGVCTGRGSEKMEQVARDRGILYPIARDQGRRTADAWNLAFYPTIVLVDRQGIVRAAGLTPSRVESAVQALLAEQPDPAKLVTKRVHDALGGALLEGDDARRTAMAENLEGRTMPALDVAGWSNARHLRDGTRMPEGTKLVVLTFLTSDDDAAVERLTALHESRAGEGVVVIGVLTDESAGEARKAMRSGAIPFAAALDRGGRVAATYGADAGEAETYLIHPNGVVLAGDVAEAQLDAAVTAALGAL